jgi:hypothetical protein
MSALTNAQMNRMSKPRRTGGLASQVAREDTSIDQLVGCNVRGRLLEILDLVKGKTAYSRVAARIEVEDLLEFFPEED